MNENYFQDVIDSLLQKKAEVNNEKEAEKAQAIAEIDAKYSERENKIDELLNSVGYVEPVEKEIVAEDPIDEETHEEAAPVEEADVLNNGENEI